MNKKFLLFLVLLISIVSVSCVSASDMTDDYAVDLSAEDESLDLETSFESSSSEENEESVDDELGLDGIEKNDQPASENPVQNEESQAPIAKEDAKNSDLENEYVEISYLEKEDAEFSNLENDEPSIARGKTRLNDWGMISTKIVVSDVSTSNNDIEDVLVTLMDYQGNPLGGLPLSVDLNGQSTYVTDDNGQIKISKKGLGIGTYFAVITFMGNDKYGLSVGTATIKIESLPVFIYAEDVTAYKGYDEYLTVTLRDLANNPCSGFSVSVDLNGETTYVTDKNGQIKVSTKGLDVGTYNAEIRFAGDGVYGQSHKTAKVNIKLEDVICEAYNLDSFLLYLSVMDAYGTPLAEAVREDVAIRFQTIIPKEHSNTLRLKYDIDTIKDKRIITLDSGKDLVIDGQGHTIDLAGSSKHDHYFVVKSGHVTFKNINFINGFNKAGDKGGAISFEGTAIGTIINCTFKNCYAENYGGAISDTSGNKLTVINSTFMGNEADDEDGGAIYAKGELYIEGCLFDSNKACVDGGAIFSDKDVHVLRSVFKSNKASGAIMHQCYGGAIRAKGNAYIDNCTFENNVAEDYGGAVYAKNIYVNQEQSKMSNFINNSADDNDGGALYAENNVKISHACLNGNTAYEDGGAIFSYNDVYVYDCVFNLNHAKGASVSECEGGAIYAYDNVHLFVKTFFTSNMADYDGGAIKCDDVYFYEPSIGFNHNIAGLTVDLLCDDDDNEGIRYTYTLDLTGTVHYEY